MTSVKRVLVLGTTGMLGVALADQLRFMGFQVIALDRPILDATHPALEKLSGANCDAVVNAMGLINRRLSQPLADFLLVNGLFPRLVADRCAQHGIPFIHVSTDCVFDGKIGPYDESAPPSAADTYGWTKSLGEPANALVLRTSIIGPELRNYYSLLCWFLSQRGNISGYRNHLWNGVSTYELARVIGEILRQGLWQPGLRHIHGEDLTKFELLQLMQLAWNKECQIEAVDDKMNRDTRLRTCYPEFLEPLAIRPMQAQLAELVHHSDPAGHWRGAD